MVNTQPQICLHMSQEPGDVVAAHMSIVRDTAENPSSEKVRLGAGCRVNPPPPVVGENFLLTSPFIESPDLDPSPPAPTPPRSPSSLQYRTRCALPDRRQDRLPH